MEIPGVLAVAVVALWLFIAASGAFPMLLLWFADFGYVAGSANPVSRAIHVVGNEWLAAAGFEPEGVIRPLGIPMVLFRHREKRTAIAVYFAAGNAAVIDMVTAFQNDVQLTTTNTVDAVVAPAPRGVVQCLPSSGLEDRWQKHLEGVRLLREHLNVAEQPMGLLSEAVRNSVRRQARQIFTRPWLILTIPYRYFVLRRRYRDVTVATQLERGWIDTRALSDLVRGFAA